MDNKLEQRIKDVAKLAARACWDGADIQIKRIEPIDESSWLAYYDEPETGTEEDDVIVQRLGDMLEASYTDEVLARLPIAEETQPL